MKTETDASATETESTRPQDSSQPIRLRTEVWTICKARMRSSLMERLAPKDRPETGGRGWAYFGTLLGLSLSMYGNIRHSLLPPSPLPAGVTPETWNREWDSVIMAAFWPVCGVILLEIISRAVVLRGWKWAGLRYGALSLIGLVAMVVSYDHLSGLLRHWGESPLVCTVGPIAIDGLMITSAVVTYLTGRAAQGKDRRTKTQAVKTQTQVVKVPRVIPVPAALVQSQVSVQSSLPVQTQTETPKTQSASVSSLTGRSSLLAERLQMIKNAEPDWLERGGDVSKKRIGEIIELPNSSGTQQKLRELLISEAKALSTQERELVTVG